MRSLFFTVALCAAKVGAVMAFSLSSSSFEHGGEMPSKYTCDGENISPHLQWSQPPKETRCFALIVDDPDAPDPSAPRMTWVHWVVFNIPSSSSFLKEGSDTLALGAQDGINDWKHTGYGGPCPPIGRHRYFFKLYALSQEIKGLCLPTKQELEKAMGPYVLAKAELVGTYQKK